MGTLGGIGVDVGDVIAKKFRLERLIGEGGTGVVVAARHLQLEQRVAIKFLRTALASDDVQMRFEREAKAIAKIQSEHVVLVLDVGALPNGLPYMVMEYLDGRDLKRVLSEDGAMKVEDAVDCMLQVCEALGEAHAAGIVHRDLKPANLFLTRRDDGPNIKVVDFGISKIIDKRILAGSRGPKEMTAQFEVLGSPRYMAPEQLRNSKTVDHRADLWSVGAVLYQLITGKHAFDAESNTQASLRVMTAEPEDLTMLAPDAPKGLEEIVKKCLTKDVAKRYQSARELAAALAVYASDEGRDSLDRMKQAKEAPSLNIALELTSMIPPTGGHKSPSPPPVPPPRAPTPLDPRMGAPPPRTMSAPPGHVASTPPPPKLPSNPPNARGDVITSPAAFKVATGQVPPDPSSLDGSVSSWRAQARRTPPYAMKIAIGVGGLVAVLLAFGFFSVVKLAARSAGVLSPSEPEPLFSAVPSAAPPSTAVTAPVLLDAGRRRP